MARAFSPNLFATGVAMNRFGRVWVVGALLALILAPVLHAQAPVKHYVINAATQGNGSGARLADAVKAAQGTVTAVFDSIGSGAADSANPNFLAAMSQASGVQGVAEDVEIQWLPQENVALAGVDAGPQPYGVNTEPYHGYQWALH